MSAGWADPPPVLELYPETNPAANPDPLDPFVEQAREFDPERGIPRWSWKAAGSFAAAVGRSTSGGDAMLRRGRSCPQAHSAGPW